MRTASPNCREVYCSLQRERQAGIPACVRMCEGRKSAEGQCVSCRLTLLLSDRTGGEKGNRGRGSRRERTRQENKRCMKNSCSSTPSWVWINSSSSDSRCVFCVCEMEVNRDLIKLRRDPHEQRIPYRKKYKKKKKKINEATLEGCNAAYCQCRAHKHACFYLRNSNLGTALLINFSSLDCCQTVSHLMLQLK